MSAAGLKGEAGFASVNVRTKPRLMVVANQKGGVGKTTTAINLGTGLAAIGRRVLIIDLDPQGNASTGVGIDRSSRALSSYDLLLGEATIPEAVVSTMIPGLDIVPSTIDLSGAELELIDMVRRCRRRRGPPLASPGALQ